MIKLPIQGCERYSHTLLVENHPVPVVDDYIKLLYPHTVPTKSSKIHKIPISFQTLLFWYPPAPPPPTVILQALPVGAEVRAPAAPLRAELNDEIVGSEVPLHVVGVLAQQRHIYQELGSLDSRLKGFHLNGSMGLIIWLWLT